MKINPYQYLLTAKLSKISLLAVLFWSFFAANASALASLSPSREAENLSQQTASNTLIARKRVFVDRYGRRYVFKGNGRRVYLNSAPRRVVRRDRYGRRIFFDRRYNRYYVFDRYGRRIYF